MGFNSLGVSLSLLVIRLCCSKRETGKNYHELVFNRALIQFQLAFLFTFFNHFLSFMKICPSTLQSLQVFLRFILYQSILFFFPKVGGIKDKVLAAHRAGVKRVILPRRNEKDLEELPANIRADLDFVMTGNLDEVLNASFDGGFPGKNGARSHPQLSSKL